MAYIRQNNTKVFQESFVIMHTYYTILRETLIYIAIESMAYSMNKHKKATAPKTLSIALYVILYVTHINIVLFSYLNATSINDPAAVTQQQQQQQ